MTIAELLTPLNKHRMKYIKVHVDDELYIFDLRYDFDPRYNADSYDRLLRHFGDRKVIEWRADFGDSLYIRI